MPVRTPLSSTSAGKPKYRSLISRRAAVTRGTPDAIASPVTCASNENPWNPRNCWNISASSSDVRSAAVAMRQWSTSSWPENSPMTVWVLPQSMVSSTRYLARSLLAGVPGSRTFTRWRAARFAPLTRTRAVDVEGEVERGGRLRDHARRHEVGAGLRVAPHVLDGHAARHLHQQSSLHELDARTHLLGRHVVEEHHRRTRVERFAHLVE